MKHFSKWISSSVTAQMALAFLFGLMFVSVLLVIAYATPNPTPFQEWVYRVVMALAAGGVGAMIPGLIEATIPGWVRAGGALACFVVVFWANPPSLARDQLRSQSYFDVIDRGESALVSGNTVLARQLFSRASEIAPDAYIPYVKFASAQFDSGHFENARQNYEIAFEKSQRSDPTLLYGAALSDEAIGNYEAAIRTFEFIADRVRKNEEYLRDVRFSIAQIKLKIWLKDPSQAQSYESAVQEFRAFLEARGQPTYWAHYHLACLFASNAARLRTEHSPSAERLEQDAVKELKDTVQDLRLSKAKKAALHRTMLLDAISSTSDWGAPGNPVICKHLQSVSDRHYRVTEALMAPLY